LLALRAQKETFPIRRASFAARKFPFIVTTTRSIFRVFFSLPVSNEVDEADR
jgi:hypothetical protein